MYIAQYKEVLRSKSDKFLQERLTSTLEDIAFLESIYMTGGANSHFSREFKQAAVEERQELCQLSSAIYSLMRERKI